MWISLQRQGALLCNYGIEGETFEYDADGVPHFSDLIYNNPTYDYRTAVFIYVMDSGPTVVDPMRGTGTYTQEQLDSWDEWQNANLDYSHVIPNKVVLEQRMPSTTMSRATLTPSWTR